MNDPKHTAEQLRIAATIIESMATLPSPQPDPYANEKKTVPLGPEDVMPGSVLSLKPPRWFIISGISDNGLYVLDDEPLVENLWRWDYLMEKAQINRSIPLTGKWNPDAWEPCSKQTDA